jgi:PAS domain S-box-containing protein
MLDPEGKFNNPKVFGLIGNLVDLGVWRYNVERDYLEWDAVMFGIYGLKRETFKNQFSDWRDIVHPEDVKGAEASFQESIKTNGQFVYTFRIIRKDSQIRFIKANAQISEVNEKGERIIIGANQDVTEILSIKEDREELLQTLEDSQRTARIGSWQYYPKTQTSVLDEVTKAIYGLPADYEIDAAEGITYYKEGYSRDTIIKAFTELLEDKKPYDLELELITAQGKTVWVRTIGRPILNSDGEVFKAVGVFQDITHLKERERALSESNLRFQGAFDYSAIGMAIVSLQGRWLQVNRRLAQFLGYSEKELLNLTFQDITHPQDLNKDLELVQACINGEIEHYQMDKRYIHKNGEALWAILSVALIRDKDQEPLYFISQIEDINERKKFERDLVEANEGLQKLSNRLSLQNQSLNDFAHITSHNLRAPVANLKLLGELYQNSNDPNYKDELFAMVQKSTHDLLDTLDSLVDSLIIKNKSGMDMQDVNLKEAVNTVLKKMNSVISSTEAKVELQIKLDLIYAQPLYLESILSNLISNAIKYKHPERKPQIKLSAYLDGNRPTITVEDNGLGIDLKRHGAKVFGLQKIFHKNSDAKGVGLFMVKTHMEAMGGEVSLESTPRKGSRFILQFKAQYK